MFNPFARHDAVRQAAHPGSVVLVATAHDLYLLSASLHLSVAIAGWYFLLVVCMWCLYYY